MAILKIFGDEAGTMPQEDDGDIFTTATISILGDYPIINNPNGCRELLIEKIKDLNAIPHIAYVKPKSGYGNAIKNKIDKMNTMARMTRLMTGANKQYLTQQRVPLRNLIWSYCMKQAIVMAIVSAIVREIIDKVEIVLDQKSMASPTERLFAKQVLLSSDQLSRVVREVEQLYPQQAALYKSRLRFTSEKTSLCWSDEPCSHGSEGGLRLAHYLASHFRKDLSISEEPEIKKLLSKEGFNLIDLNCTDKLTAPFDSRVIEEWEKNTGLREPI